MHPNSLKSVLVAIVAPLSDSCKGLNMQDPVGLIGAMAVVYYWQALCQTRAFLLAKKSFWVV